jgi:protein O-mannosyl-transferase
LASSATATGLERKTAPGRPSTLFFSREKRSTVLCLGLVLMTLAFYNPVVNNKFTNMDDEVYITRNAHVKAGLSWDTVKWAFTSVEQANWHPLTWLSHALDYQLFRLNPAGHHYVNLLFHAGNVLLLFLLLQAATGLTWPSCMVAALFAIHPINVESVAWASERKNVLSMLFFLLAIGAYERYVRAVSVKKYLVVAALFALGLMAKPEIITLPFVLLLWDYWPLKRMFPDSPEGGTPQIVQPRSFSYLLLEKTPLLLLSAGSAVITLIAQDKARRSVSIWIRLANGAVAYVRYLGKAFWPWPLSSMYPLSGRFPSIWQMLGAPVLLLAVTAFVFKCHRRRYLVTGWFWFLGTLVPVIGLIQVGFQAMADRYAYISFIGLFIALVWFVTEFTCEWKVSPAFVAVPSLIILATLGMVTRKQITYWHDSVTLWQHALAVTKDNYFAHNALADALAQRGDVEGAISNFDAAERFGTYGSIDSMALAAYKRNHGHIREAIDEYIRAISQSSDSKMRSLALSRLALTFLQVGDVANAKGAAEEAIKQNPKNGSAWVASGLITEREGNFALAAERISQGMKVEQTDIGYLLLADAYRRAGQPEAAQQATETAEHISPKIEEARQETAEVLANAGIKADASPNAAGLGDRPENR